MGWTIFWFIFKLLLIIGSFFIFISLISGSLDCLKGLIVNFGVLKYEKIFQSLISLRCNKTSSRHPSYLFLTFNQLAFNSTKIRSSNFASDQNGTGSSVREPAVAWTFFFEKSVHHQHWRNFTTARAAWLAPLAPIPLHRHRRRRRCRQGGREQQQHQQEVNRWHRFRKPGI